MVTGGVLICGVLLAAGEASRYGSCKLLQPLADGIPMAVVAARNLLQVLPRVVSVVRSGDAVLAAQLTGAGAEVVFCEDADRGMGRSLACGVRATADAGAWLVALADMPFVQRATIAGVTRFMAAGAAICQPVYADQRGHPVGFAHRFYDDLIALDGDSGARGVIARHNGIVELLKCDDPGCIRDIDTPADLPAGSL